MVKDEKRRVVTLLLIIIPGMTCKLRMQAVERRGFYPPR